MKTQDLLHAAFFGFFVSVSGWLCLEIATLKLGPANIISYGEKSSPVGQMNTVASVAKTEDEVEKTEMVPLVEKQAQPEANVSAMRTLEANAKEARRFHTAAMDKFEKSDFFIMKTNNPHLLTESIVMGEEEGVFEVSFRLTSNSGSTSGKYWGKAVYESKDGKLRKVFNRKMLSPTSFRKLSSKRRYKVDSQGHLSLSFVIPKGAKLRNIQVVIDDDMKQKSYANRVIINRAG